MKVVLLRSSGEFYMHKPLVQWFYALTDIPLCARHNCIRSYDRNKKIVPVKTRDEKFPAVPPYLDLLKSRSLKQLNPFFSITQKSYGGVFTRVCKPDFHQHRLSMIASHRYSSSGFCSCFLVNYHIIECLSIFVKLIFSLTNRPVRVFHCMSLNPCCSPPCGFCFCRDPLSSMRSLRPWQELSESPQ
ncbi:hypothetical protein SAMN02745751_00781 [Dethiosulfatibacter aminovorans DSM 17477]|uniref:Uncharacterized protein n=1 Tax=Dethiosulfatibacter aminovorans DSM 17477 TaxID=1121476 RepID=A0A1M6D595_9FIRM|nr:hypothetical protein SAMN02745751_00781 [Dethiosulfatibacter aminovorans DSM 17477]